MSTHTYDFFDIEYMLSGYLAIQAGKRATGKVIQCYTTATHFQGFVKTVRKIYCRLYTVSVRIITVKHLIVNSVIPGNLVLSHTHTQIFEHDTECIR